MDGRGLYRTITEHGTAYAWVAYEAGGGTDVREDDYRARGHEPAFETLPTKSEWAVASLADGGSDGSPG